MLSNALCPRCGMESALHLFRDCVYAREIWSCWAVFGLDEAAFYQLGLKEWLTLNCKSMSRLIDNVPWGVPFSMTLWEVWRFCKKWIFQNLMGDSSRVWNWARSMALELHGAMQRKVPFPRVGQWVSWKAPNPNCYILNTDGAFNKSANCASAGGLIRDCNAEWVRGFVVNIGGH